MRCRKSISTFARSLSRSRGHWVPIFLSGILQCFLLPQGQLAWLTCFNLDLPYEEMKGLSYPPHTLSGCLGNLYKGVEAETAALPSLTPTHRVNKGVWGGRVEYGKESVLSRTTASEKALRLARSGGSEEEIVASGAGAQGDGWAAVALRCLPSTIPLFLAMSLILFQLYTLPQATHCACGELTSPWVPGWAHKTMPTPHQLRGQGGHMTRVGQEEFCYGLPGKSLPHPPRRASQSHPPSLLDLDRGAATMGAAVPIRATRGHQSQAAAAPGRL